MARYKCFIIIIIIIIIIINSEVVLLVKLGTVPFMAAVLIITCLFCHVEVFPN